MDNTTAGAGVGRDLTYGEKAVGLNFNPSNNGDVQSIKLAFAAIIDQCTSFITAEQANATPNTEKIRQLKIAITEAQTAQMWAVKGITYQF